MIVVDFPEKTKAFGGGSVDVEHTLSRILRQASLQASLVAINGGVVCLVPHEAGRVLRDGAVSPGEYVAGWIKRGPSGVVGTNKHDARETVAGLLADAADGVLRTHGPVGDLVDELVARGVEPVLLDNWRAIDAAEIALGATKGRARTTLHERESLLAAARAAAAAAR